MKLNYVDSYVKRVSRIENGVPVIVNGKVVQDERDMYLYAVTNATPEEITLYKRFKRDNPDGKDYYRESDNGIPLWHNPEFVGMVADISTYKDSEGKVRFRVNRALKGALEGLRKLHPTLGDKIDEQLWALMFSGGVSDLNKLGSTIAPSTDGGDGDKIVETSGDTPEDNESPETPDTEGTDF